MFAFELLKGFGVRQNLAKESGHQKHVNIYMLRYKNLSQLTGFNQLLHLIYICSI